MPMGTRKNIMCPGEEFSAEGRRMRMEYSEGKSFSAMRAYLLPNQHDDVPMLGLKSLGMRLYVSIMNVNSVSRQGKPHAYSE